MTDIIVLLIIIAIIGAASYYVYSEKKKGTKCIGCSSGAACNSKKNPEDKCNCGN